MFRRRKALSDKKVNKDTVCGSEQSPRCALVNSISILATAAW